MTDNGQGMAQNFDELKRELLDHRSKLVDWWLAATAIFLTSMSVFMTFFVIVIAIVGYFGFQRFEDIETRAEGHAEEAGRIVEQIKGMHSTAQTLVESMNAETVRNDPDKASEVVETVQQSPVASPIDRAIAVAILLQQQGEIEQAIEKWRSIANVAEGVDSQLQARAWFSVGYLYGEEDNWEAAVGAYDKALELNPDLVEAYNNRGVMQNKLGQYEAALADLNEAIRLKPNYLNAYNNRGVAKRNLGQYDEALADYDKALELEPNDAEVYYNRGSVKNDLGQHSEALADYDKALELEPNAIEVYNGRGNAKNGLGQPEAALADYNEAIRLDPDYAHAYNNRGLTKRNLGLLKEAREDYQKALALAQESGSEEFIAKVQDNLSQLDNDETP